MSTERENIHPTRNDGLLLWLDMEMTGLDPESCVPIEVALIVTDGNLMEKETFHAVIHQDSAALASMSEFVRDMHTHNGLLTRVAASKTTLEETDATLAALVARHLPEGGGVLAGNSIHQDRRFIVRYFPMLEKHLHYRMVDVSTLKEVVRRWYGEEFLFPKAESDHTALSDTRQSIAELAYYRGRCFR